MDLEQLIKSSAALLVGAMITDAWSAVKICAVRLFGRNDDTKEASIEYDLERAHNAITAASETDRSAIIYDHEAELRGWLRAQLRDDPELATQWKILTDELTRQIDDKAVSRSVRQIGISRDDSTFIQVAGNNYQIPPRL